MLFWKRKKDYTPEEMAEIVREFSTSLREVLRDHLPRKMRRAMQKNDKKQHRMIQANQDGQFQEIKKKGLSAWLDESVGEVYQELSSYVPDPSQLQADLQAYAKQFKKVHNVK